MSTITSNFGEYIPQDILFRFEFDERYFINSFVVRADTFSSAIDQVILVLGDSIMDYVIFIHKIS